MKVRIYDPNKVVPEGDVAVRLVANEHLGTVSIETVGKHGGEYWILTLSEAGVRRTGSVAKRLGFLRDDRGAVKDYV